MVIPMVSRMVVPVIANKVRMQKEMKDPRMAIERLTDADSPAVKPKNKGALPIGSAITKSVTKALNKLSIEGTEDTLVD